MATVVPSAIAIAAKSRLKLRANTLECSEHGVMNEDVCRRGGCGPTTTEAGAGARRPLGKPGTELADWPVEEHRALARQVARASVTVLRNANKTLPLVLHRGSRVGVVDFIGTRFSPVEDHDPLAPSVSDLLRRRCENLRALAVEADPSDGYAAVGSLVDEADVLVVLARNAASFERQAALVRWLLDAGKPAALVAMRNPYDLLAFPRAECCVACYGDPACSVEAVADLLCGDYRPRGGLPVDLPGLFEVGAGLTRFY